MPRNPVKKNMDKMTKPSTHVDRKKASQRGYSKHKGQTDPDIPDTQEKPTKQRTQSQKKTYPSKAFIDGDMLLFAAASIGEQIWYVAKDKEDNEIDRFESANAYKIWLDDIELFGQALSDGVNPEEITRHVEYEVKDFEDSKKAFESLVNEWVKGSGCDNFTVYLSKATGAENFRYEVATIKPYKGSRKDVHKPHYLEPLRKWAAKLPYVKMARGTVEVDDVVCALAQRNGKNGCVVAGDKDSRTSMGCYVYIPDEMKKPALSAGHVVGRIRKNDKNKVVGLGYLFLFYQALAGDSADNIGGCKGIGTAKAFSLLEEFHNQPIDRLDDLLDTVCQAYKKAYGNRFTYKHHTTEEEMIATWQDVLIENLHLLYMKKSQNDICPFIETIKNKPL